MKSSRLLSSSLPLVFLARKLKIKNLEIVGQKKIGHVKMTLESENQSWPAIFWNASDKIAPEVKPGAYADVIFRVGNNYYQNNYMPQLIVLDMAV